MIGTVLDLTRNRTARWTFNIVDSTAGATGYTATLAGATVTWRAKHDRRDADGAAIITKTATITANGDASNPGVVVVTVDAADSSALPAADGVLEWALTVADASGKSWVPLYGPLTVRGV